MTETTTIQLDPEAVEAAAKKFYESAPLCQSWDYGHHEFEWGDPYVEREQKQITEVTTTAITAFIAAIEPQLRELVDTLEYCIQDLMWSDPNERAVSLARNAALRNVLFGLLGLTDGEPTPTSRVHEVFFGLEANV